MSIAGRLLDGNSFQVFFGVKYDLDAEGKSMKESPMIPMDPDKVKKWTPFLKRALKEVKKEIHREGISNSSRLTNQPLKIDVYKALVETDVNGKPLSWYENLERQRFVLNVELLLQAQNFFHKGWTSGKNSNKFGDTSSYSPFELCASSISKFLIDGQKDDFPC